MSVKKYLGETSLASLWAKIKALIPTKTSDLTNDAGYLTSYTETDPTVPSWAKQSTKPTYTASEVGAATSTHTHGDITNSGDITTTATIASGDRLVINDESASKITNSSITFGDSTTTFLANNGTWQTPTDTKVTATPLNGTNSGRGVLFASDTGTTASTDTVATSNKLMYNDYSAALTIYNSNKTKNSEWDYDSLTLANSSTSYYGRLKTEGLTAARTYTFPDKTGTVAMTSDIPTVPTKTSDLTNDSGFITDAGVTSFNGSTGAITYTAPVTSVNGQTGAVTVVEDDKTWNGVTLELAGTVQSSSTNEYYVPGRSTTSAITAYQFKATSTPGKNHIAKYDVDSYLISTTPSANDNSTKVATTAYVDNAIPSAYDASTNPNGYLTLATLPVYDGSYTAITS